MLSKNLFVVILMGMISHSLLADTFSIAPYIFIGDNNHITMGFRTSQSVKLDIHFEVKNKINQITSTKSISDIYNSTDLQKVDLGQLGCDAILHYTVKSNGVNVEADRSLYPLPCNNSEPLYFGFMSDTQIMDAAGQKRATMVSNTIQDLRKLYPFSLIVNGGDVTQDGGMEELWTNFFQTARVYLQDTFLLAAVGNHEYRDSVIYEKAPPQFLNYLRDANSSDLGNSILDLGRITIIVLNSNFEYMNEARVNEQFAWVESKLKENQKLNKPVILTMHHSPFSSTVDYLRSTPTKLRDVLVPMMEKYSCAKMLISGHLHMYERSEKNGKVYLAAGPAGGRNNYITYENPYKVFIKPLVTTFSIFKVTDKQIEVTTITGLKEMIDHFIIDL